MKAWTGAIILLLAFVVKTDVVCDDLTGLQSSELSFQNTKPGVTSVGSTSCAACHADIYQKYRETAMGRSMTLATEPWSLEKVSSPVTVLDQQRNRYLQVFRRSSDIYQAEYGLDSEGQEQHRQDE